MGMLVPPGIDVLGDCETCGEPLSRYGGHAACEIERLTAERDHARHWMRAAAEKLLSDEPEPQAVARVLLNEADEHAGRAIASSREQ